MPPELQELIEGINTKFDAFKKANDERLAILEKGQPVPAELEAKIVKIEESIAGQEAVKDRLDAIDTAIKRGAFGKHKTDDEVSAQKQEYADLLCKYMRGGDEGGKGWSEKEVSRVKELHTSLAEQKLLAVQSDPDGGYWVSPDETGRIVERVFETSPMRQVASVQAIGTDALEGIVDDDEAGAEWVGETEAPTNEDTPKIGKWRIPVHEQATRPKATNKLLEDSSVNIETWLAGKVARRFARAENLAFVSGDSVGKPRGFLDYGASASIETYDRLTIGRLITAAVGAVSFDDLLDLQGALKTAYEVMSTWAMNRRTKKDIRKLKDNDGQYLWQPSLQVGEPETLLGRAMVMFEDLPDVATDALPIAIADWTEAYQVVDRTGISVLRDPYTAKPFVEFYTRKRVGGDVINTDAIKIMQIQ
jgi:HK97 family phage major capsid protein